jgi:hypothetical protein
LNFIHIVPESDERRHAGTVLSLALPDADAKDDEPSEGSRLARGAPDHRLPLPATGIRHLCPKTGWKEDVMYVLNYWHTVTDYGEWKKVFDSDPLGREASGVRRLDIERPVDDEKRVIGHLEFDSLGEAETFAERLQEVWKGVGGSVISDAGITLTEVLETRDYRSATSRKAA